MTDIPIIRLQDVALRREHMRRPVLEPTTFSINRGDFMAITGPNGGGKTTLLRIILRLLRPSEGTVTYFDTAGKPTDRLAASYLPQNNRIDSRFPITVREVVASGLIGIKGVTKGESAERTASEIARVGLEEVTNRAIGELSGGQLQRTLLARALVSRPELLVLDEPLSYLDTRHRGLVTDIAASLRGHTTMIVVSHEMTDISSLANRHLTVDRTVAECHSRHHAVHYDCPT